MMILLFYVTSIPVLWAFFVIVMKLKVSPPKKPLYYLAYAFFIFAYFWDILCNLIVLPFVFLELPHEFTVSARIQRHAVESSGWRKNLSVWFATKLINPYSPTPHIHL